MRLYELVDSYRADIAKLQDLDMPPEAVLDTIDGMQGEVSEKIKAVLIVSMEMDAEAEIRKAHGQRMMDSAKSMAGRADGLLSYAQIAIQNCGLALPLKYPEFSVNLRKNPPSCEVTDAELLPTHLVSREVTFQVSGDTRLLLDLVNDATRDNYLSPGYASCPTVAVKADKRAVLESLKAIELVNEAKQEGQEKDRLPGAHMNPAGFRIVIK